MNFHKIVLLIQSLITEFTNHKSLVCLDCDLCPKSKVDPLESHCVIPTLPINIINNFIKAWHVCHLIYGRCIFFSKLYLHMFSTHIHVRSVTLALCAFRIWCLNYHPAIDSIHLLELLTGIVLSVERLNNVNMTFCESFGRF